MVSVGNDGTIVSTSRKLMSHWDARQEWFYKPDGFKPDLLSELWHGQCFRELSLWNNTEAYLLPLRCPECTKIVSIDVLKNARSHACSSVDSRNIDVSSPHCSSDFNSPLQYTYGDPCNQAIIIHEDGWSPHSTFARHSIAAITITHACTTKADRCDANNARINSFTPVNQLPNDAPHKYNAFFEPLLKEIEESLHQTTSPLCVWCHCSLLLIPVHTRRLVSPQRGDIVGVGIALRQGCTFKRNAIITMGILGVNFSSALLFAPWRTITRRDARLIKLPR